MNNIVELNDMIFFDESKNSIFILNQFLLPGKKEVMDQIVITGDRTVPLRLLKYMSPIVRTFNIIEP